MNSTRGAENAPILGALWSLIIYVGRINSRLSCFGGVKSAMS